MSQIVTGIAGGSGSAGSTTPTAPATPDPHIDTDARLDIQTLDERTQDFFLEPSRVVISGGTGWAAGYEWRNETGDDVTLPSSVSETSLEALGLTKVLYAPSPPASVTGSAAPQFATVGTSSNVGNHFTGTNNATDIFHIKTPFGPGILTGMFHFKAQGFAYGAPAGDGIIDVTWVGYSFTNSLLKPDTQVLGSATTTAGSYVGSDGYVYLWFKTANVYYSSFNLSSMHVGNGRVLSADDIEIIQSPDATL